MQSRMNARNIAVDAMDVLGSFHLDAEELFWQILLDFWHQ